MYKIFFIIILLLFSCDENNVNNSSNHDHNRVYVSLQDSDAVSVVSSDNLEIIDEVNISLSSVNCSITLSNISSLVGIFVPVLLLL